MRFPGGRIPSGKCSIGPFETSLSFISPKYPFPRFGGILSRLRVLPCDARDVDMYFDPVLLIRESFPAVVSYPSGVSLKPRPGRPPSHCWGSNDIFTRHTAGHLNNLPRPASAGPVRCNRPFLKRTAGEALGGCLEKGSSGGEKTMAGSDALFAARPPRREPSEQKPIGLPPVKWIV